MLAVLQVTHQCFFQIGTGMQNLFLLPYTVVIYYPHKSSAYPTLDRGISWSLPISLKLAHLSHTLDNPMATYPRPGFHVASTSLLHLLYQPAHKTLEG